jgi:Cu-Zn family superoxide dismutase
MRTCLTLSLLVALAACGRAPDPVPAPPAATTPPATTPAPTPPPAATPAPAPEPAVRAKVAIAPIGTSTVNGELTLVPDSTGLAISGELRGLEASRGYAFHIHDSSDCAAPGEHFNPGGQPHGDPQGASHHTGDMPNQTAGDDGIARVSVQLGGVTLGDGSALDVVRRVVVVHAQPDDYATQPSGNSGEPIACGVIQLDATAMPATAPAP